MIGISTKVYDLNGFVTFNSTKVRMNTSVDMSRRVNKQKTLDGGAFTSDFGYTPVDRDYNITLLGISREELDILKNIVELHSESVITTREGAFNCILSLVKQFDIRNGETKIKLQVTGVA